MSRSSALVVPSLLASLAFPACGADPAASPTGIPIQPAGATAADLYRSAFALLATLDTEDKNRLGLCGVEGCWVVTTPLDDAATNLLKRQRETITLARAAAKLPPPEWELKGDVRRMLELSHNLPRLSALLVLEARQSLKDGKPDEAVDDLLAAMTISRHIAAARTMQTSNIEMLAWRPAAEALAQALPTLPKLLIGSVSERMEQLPPSPTFAQIIEGEYAFAQDTVVPQGKMAVVLVAAMKGFHDSLAENAHLPPDEFATFTNKRIKDFPLNPFVKLLGPSFVRTRQIMALFETRQAMLKTAIDIVMNGEAALAKSKDPYGDGPFELHKRPGGFELRSDLKLMDQPLKWVVGT